MALEVFKRVEQKYLITPKQFEQLTKLSKKYLDKDPYYFTSINSLYFDTKNNDLIIRSLDKPIYKEKVRLRYYDTPTKDNNYFLELKKKYKGVVYKRRVVLNYDDMLNYINKGIIPSNCDNQRMREIDYAFKYYSLIPAAYIAYDRYSYLGKDNKNFRLTFDHNVKYRFDNLDINNQDGEYLLKDLYIMEVKTNDSLPLWFTKILTKLEIYPASYSKYGEAYKRRFINV